MAYLSRLSSFPENSGTTAIEWIAPKTYCFADIYVGSSLIRPDYPIVIGVLRWVRVFLAHFLVLTVQLTLQASTYSLVLSTPPTPPPQKRQRKKKLIIEVTMEPVQSSAIQPALPRAWWSTCAMSAASHFDPVRESGHRNMYIVKWETSSSHPRLLEQKKNSQNIRGQFNKETTSVVFYNCRVHM